MPLFEYFLLALIGTGGVSGPAGLSKMNPPRPLSADAIVQPNGGVTVVGAPQDKKDSRVKPQTVKHTRHHKRRHKGTTPPAKKTG
jgi:hypothetical protein